ncbi:MAG: endonuclease III [Actinomycetota bacterium]|nr:endonuclease III [Actinomycetota bacterium]
MGEAERLRAEEILERLKERYPKISTALTYRDPWELLVVAVLSAQTTDENVNAVSPKLFARWPRAQDLAGADAEEVEDVIYSTGFYRQKTRSIIALSQDLVERYQGEVPADLEELTTLRGVGRKTASVVLAEAFAMPAVAVDTHVRRVSARLGLTRHREPVKIERDLKAIFPETEWAKLSVRLIQFGREVCIARRPRCWKCELAELCPYPDKTPPPHE